MLLYAYKVRDVLVFANRGTHAKLIAAPEINTKEYWANHVTEWVGLRAERAPEFDHLLDPSKTEAYLYVAS